jgi:hypothetical protein
MPTNDAGRPWAVDARPQRRPGRGLKPITRRVWRASATESLVVYAIELNPLDPVVPSISLRRATQRCVAPSVQRASGVSARRAHIRVRILLERRLASESGRPRGVIGLAKPLVLMNAARASDVGGHLSRMGGME